MNYQEMCELRLKAQDEVATYLMNDAVIELGHEIGALHRMARSAGPDAAVRLREEARALEAQQDEILAHAMALMTQRQVPQAQLRPEVEVNDIENTRAER